MEVPKTLRILGRPFEIHVETLSEDLYGFCVPGQCRIAITDTLHPIDQADTVLHEVLHALAYLMHLNLPYKQEEHVVGKLSTGLIQVFNDNPEFLAYLHAVANKHA